MRKTIAIFLLVIYSSFTTGTVWSSPVFESFSIQNGIEQSNKEIGEEEPFRDFETFHLSRVAKNLPVKFKVPRAQTVAALNKPTIAAEKFLSFRPPLGLQEIVLPGTPIFIKNNVFRI